MPRRVPQDREAFIKLEVGLDGPKDAEIISELRAAGFSLAKWRVVYLGRAQRRELDCVVHWRRRPVAENRRESSGDGPRTRP